MSSINKKDNADYIQALAELKKCNLQFRYWVHKVLPLVYDDSLSYYEVWSKFVSIINNMDECIDKLVVDIGNLYDSVTALQEYMNDYYSDIIDAINDNDSRITVLESWANGIDELIDDIEEDIAGIHDTLNDYGERIDSLEEEFESLENRINIAENDINNLEEIYGDIKEGLETLENQVSINTQGIASNKSSIDTINNSIATLENLITNLQNQYSALNESLDNLWTQFEECCNNINALIESLDERVTELETKISDIETSITDIYNQLTDIYNKISSIESDITSIYSSINEIEGDISEINENITNIEDNVETNTTNITNLYEGLQAISLSSDDSSVSGSFDVNGTTSIRYLGKMDKRYLYGGYIDVTFSSIVPSDSLIFSVDGVMYFALDDESANELNGHTICITGKIDISAISTGYKYRNYFILSCNNYIELDEDEEDYNDLFENISWGTETIYVTYAKIELTT